MSPVYLSAFTISWIIKHTCYKILYENYGAKSVKDFTIFSIFLGFSVLFYNWKIQSKDILFHILNGLAWGFMCINVDIESLKRNKL